ncbi:MAG: spore maturation protein [Lachnospiraceae bacterium]|nr:spore maturation protein [Eubacteriales bacterium]MDY2608547.1 spore maturation protein [Lachnospiraceae bacterium]
MKVILYLSDMMIPFVVFYIVGIGIIQKNKVYDDFIEGAKDGLKTVVGVMPTMVGLMIGVGVLSSSGFLNFFTKQIAKVTLKIGLPSAVVPAMIVRMFSSSAATGLVLDVFKQFGTDSYEGLLSSIMMSSTETIFYTMSVYFMTAKVTKTRWTLAGALISTLAGIIASVIMTKMMI